MKVKTGVFLDDAELKNVKEKVAKAQLASMTAVRFGPTYADNLWKELRTEIHSLALSRGLPDIEGFYGVSNDGEFVTED